MNQDHLRFDRYLEGCLAPEQLAQLEAELQSDESLRREFASYLAMHGALSAQAESLLADGAPPQVTLWKAPLVGIAAALMIGIGMLFGKIGESPPSAPMESIATLVDVRAAQWGASTLPTAPDSRLGVGKLSLVKGLATVRFDDGASLTLEAPSTVEILSASRCRLLDGAAVAWVPDGAEGFKIETADALVTDYGTRFGITADANGQRSEVLVLEGEVGVDHFRDDAPEQRLMTGEMVRYDDSQLLLKGAAESNETDRGKFSSESEGWTEFEVIADSYIRNGYHQDQGQSPLIMVKHSTDFVKNRRKGYLRFSTDSLPESLMEAEILLSIQPSGMGYASVVPDSTFAVYGVADASWAEASLRWGSAPANDTKTGDSLLPGAAIRLGEFVVPQGVSSGVATLGGLELLNFIKAHRGAELTFIVVRETDETDRHGLVHAFASREHPSAPAPVLRVK